MSRRRRTALGVAAAGIVACTAGAVAATLPSESATPQVRRPASHTVSPTVDPALVGLTHQLSAESAEHNRIRSWIAAERARLAHLRAAAAAAAAAPPPAAGTYSPAVTWQPSHASVQVAPTAQPTRSAYQPSTPPPVQTSTGACGAPGGGSGDDGGSDDGGTNAGDGGSDD
jgi:hypothetical protein